MAGSVSVAYSPFLSRCDAKNSPKSLAKKPRFPDRQVAVGASEVAASSRWTSTRRLHRIEDRLGLGLADGLPCWRSKAPDIALDGVEGADERERLGHDRRAGVEAWISKNFRRTCAQQNASATGPPSASAL